MKRIIGILFASICLVPPAFSQDWAKAALAKSPRHQEWVTVTHDGRSVQCFVVYPEVKDKAPVVLVIPEIFGLSDWAKDETDQLAAAGYIAIAPDLLSGLGDKGGGTAEIEKAGGVSAVTKAVSGLPADQVLADLDAAADYITKDAAASDKLSVAGFCWGGGKSFAYATHRKGLSAAYVFYGTPPPAEAMANITCPVYGFYAGMDARISLGVPAATKAMKAAGKTYEPVVYDGAGHGFMRAGEDPEAKAANKKAHDDAWARWLTLLKQ